MPRRNRLRRVAPLTITLGVVAAACGSGSSAPASVQTGQATAQPETTRAESPHGCSTSPVASSERAVRSSGLDWIFGTPLAEDFGEPTIDRSRVVPVLRPDGIPAIDTPQCAAVDDVSTLEDDAAVVAFEIGGEARAYPLEILTWHELVNDTVGGVPVTVSYCPLCNSAIVYDRRVGDRVLDFGTSGSLTQSSMVMYDRQTESLWTHFTGQSFAGELTGTQLELFASSVLSWATFRSEFPDGLVLTRDTGFSRAYGTNPYPGYETGDDPVGQFITDDIDPRLPPKQRVVGIEIDGDAVAVPHDSVAAAGVIEVTVAGAPLTVWHQPGTASALDGRSVSEGVDVGSVGVFRPRAGGRGLTFVRAEAGFVDNETGSTWTIGGRAVDGPLAGQNLETVPHLDTFWFAWGTFFPSTTIAP